MWLRCVGQSSWCSWGTYYCACSKCWAQVSGRCPCAHTRGGRYRKLLSADNLSANLTLRSFSHFTTFQKAEETRKKERKKKLHTVPPPSGGFRPASTRFWHARYWQPQRPTFLSLCCYFKSKVRLVIWKHKNTDTLALLGKTLVGAKAFRQGLFSTFTSDGMAPG